MSNQFKEKGNIFFKRNDYENAKIYYTKGIDIEPNEILYSNRSVCNLNLGLIELALNDAQKAIDFKPSYFKGYYRKSEAYQKWGNYQEAIKCIKEGLSNINKDDIFSKDQLNLLYNNIHVMINIRKNFLIDFENKDFKSAISKLENLLVKATYDIDLIKKKIYILSIMNDFENSQKYFNLNSKLLMFDKDFFLIKSYIPFFNNDLSSAKRILMEGTKSDPDNKNLINQLKKIKEMESLKENGNNLVKAKKYSEAIHIYEKSLLLDNNNKKFNSIVYSNILVCYKNLNNLDLALNNINLSIKNDEKNGKSWFKKAEILKNLKDYEEAENCYKQAAVLDKNTDYRYYLTEIAKLVKTNQNKDFYKIWGVTKESNINEIKRAYKKLALKYHPDRNCQSEDQKRKAEKLFREVNEAYSVLSDPNKKKRYDMGMYDENSGPGNFNPEDFGDFLQGGDIFNMFFQRGSNNHFNFPNGNQFGQKKGNSQTFHFSFN